MSMGYSAAYADVIEDSTIKKYCPKEFQALQNAIEDSSFEWLDVARASQFDNIELDCNKEIADTYKNLCDMFEKRTGLLLDLGYHDCEDDGDKYDEVDGIFWAVGNVYTYTPAGKTMKKYISRKQFVQFG